MIASENGPMDHADLLATHNQCWGIWLICDEHLLQQSTVASCRANACCYYAWSIIYLQHITKGNFNDIAPAEQEIATEPYFQAYIACLNLNMNSTSLLICLSKTFRCHPEPCFSPAPPEAFSVSCSYFNSVSNSRIIYAGSDRTGDSEEQNTAGHSRKPMWDMESSEMQSLQQLRRRIVLSNYCNSCSPRIKLHFAQRSSLPMSSKRSLLRSLRTAILNVTRLWSTKASRAGYAEICSVTCMKLVHTSCETRNLALSNFSNLLRSKSTFPLLQTRSMLYAYINDTAGEVSISTLAAVWEYILPKQMFRRLLQDLQDSMHAEVLHWMQRAHHLSGLNGWYMPQMWR